MSNKTTNSCFPTNRKQSVVLLIEQSNTNIPHPPSASTDNHIGCSPRDSTSSGAVWNLILTHNSLPAKTNFQKWKQITWPRVSANHSAQEAAEERLLNGSSEAECWATAPSAGILTASPPFFFLPHCKKCPSVQTSHFETWYISWNCSCRCAKE